MHIFLPVVLFFDQRSYFTNFFHNLFESFLSIGFSFPIVNIFLSLQNCYYSK